MGSLSTVHCFLTCARTAWSRPLLLYSFNHNDRSCFCHQLVIRNSDYAIETLNLNERNLRHTTNEITSSTKNIELVFSENTNLTDAHALINQEAEVETWHARITATSDLADVNNRTCLEGVMSLSREGYDKAKKRASKRLGKWTEDARSDKGSGIERLLAGYPRILRRIQFDKYPNVSNIYNRPMPVVLKPQETARNDVATQEKQIISASAEIVSHQPTPEQRKTISESSLCEIRVDSRKSRNGRASRVSVESPFRMCVRSSRDHYTESRLRSSELSNYAPPTDNDHDVLKNIDEVGTHPLIDSKKTFENPSCKERNDSIKTPTVNKYWTFNYYEKVFIEVKMPLKITYII